MNTETQLHRGIITDVKASELPGEAWNEFSNAPFEFEDTVLDLWEDTQKSYYHACTANRFSESYLTLCTQLEKNIRQLGSFCLTKAVLEQKGITCSKLSDLSIRELVGMVSFHLRKAHAAFDGIYRDNNILGVTYLNWEFRWFGLGNRLKATEVKIQKIKDGHLNADSMLEQAETFKGEGRTNNTPASEPKSLRAHSGALPLNGSVAREMIRREEAAVKREKAFRKDIEDAAKIWGQKFDWQEIDRMAEIEKQRQAKERERSESTSGSAQESEEETITEAEARKTLIEDAMRRGDQQALMEIPREDQYQLLDRWNQYLERIEKEYEASLHHPGGSGPRGGPSDDVRKALREKRKKKKRS